MKRKIRKVKKLFLLLYIHLKIQFCLMDISSNEIDMSIFNITFNEYEKNKYYEYRNLYKLKRELVKTKNICVN